MELVRDKRVKDALMNSTIQNMFDRGELRKDHPLQRKPGRWNNSDRDGLVATVLKDEDIDSIKVCEQLTENGVILWVIDGLQRLTTLNSYLNNGFKIGSSVEFPVVTYQAARRDSGGNLIKDEYGSYAYELLKYDLRGKFYKDLPIELKEKFNNYKIDMVKHLNCTDEEIGYHIRRYNKQKSMNGSENAVTYMDNIAKEVKRISINNQFFKNDTYRQLERNNGTIERVVTESVMCMFHFDAWKKQSKKMGEFLNKHSNKQEFDRLNENLNRLATIYKDDYKDIFTSKDSFIWFTLFNKFIEMGFEDKRFSEFIDYFKINNLSEKEINGATFCEVDKNKSTKDKAVIGKKLDILETLLIGFLNSETKPVEKIDLESFVADVLNLDKQVIHDDMNFYNSSLDDLTGKTIKDGSKLLSEENRASLLAMMVYSYQEEVDLDKWLTDYAAKNQMFYADQKRNFLNMKDDFEHYCGNNVKSA